MALLVRDRSRFIYQWIMDKGQAGFAAKFPLRDQRARLDQRAPAGCWDVAKPALSGALQLILVLPIIFGEWGWRPLANLLATLSRWRTWAALEAGIVRLPPQAAFVVVFLPVMLLLPLKCLALVLVATGHIALACLLFVATKLVATALIARLFQLTKPALLQIVWFANAYARVMPWKEALVAKVRASWVWRAGHHWKQRARGAVARLARQAWPTLFALLARASHNARRLHAAAVPCFAALRVLWPLWLQRAIAGASGDRSGTTPRAMVADGRDRGR